MDDFEYINAEEPCPECGIHAPKKQIDNLKMCERCSMKGKIKQNDKKLNPERSLYDKWKCQTPVK